MRETPLYLRGLAFASIDPPGPYRPQNRTYYSGCKAPASSPSPSTSASSALAMRRCARLRRPCCSDSRRQCGASIGTQGSPVAVQAHSHLGASPNGQGFKPWPAAGGKASRYTRCAVRRSTVLLVMLFAMFWQSLALARVGSTVNVLADLEHAALHWQEEGHHHHDDGSYHLDDSIESTQHVLSDQVTATSALLVTASHDFPPLGSAAPGGLRKPLVPDPTLDGLLRPPRFRT